MAKDIFVRSASDIEQMQIAYNNGVQTADGVPVSVNMDPERPIYNAMYQHGANYARLKHTIADLEEELAAANHELQNTKACLHARNSELALANATIEAAPQWAEGLIVQLPDTHEGRNSWLLNHGKGDEAMRVQEHHAMRLSHVVTQSDRRETLPPASIFGKFASDTYLMAANIADTMPETPRRKHNHYFRPFPFADIDIYRLLLVYEVTDPCAQHAIKKLLAMGKRGHKDAAKDVQDVIDTMTRWQELRAEEGKVGE